MFAIVTAAGDTKEQVLARLQQAVKELEKQISLRMNATNMLCSGEFEYELWVDLDFVAMNELLKGVFTSE